jgi:hypothetical protein
MIPDLKPELKSMIDGISRRNTYYGNRISDSILRMLVIEETELNCGVVAPYWLGVLERGRGVRKSSKSSGLVNIIYRWMEKRGMFKSVTAEGKRNEAKRMTWYINKHGNQQFRNKTFVDIYTSERKIAIERINEKFVSQISKITMDIL